MATSSSRIVGTFLDALKDNVGTPSARPAECNDKPVSGSLKLKAMLPVLDEESETYGST